MQLFFTHVAMYLHVPLFLKHAARPLMRAGMGLEGAVKLGQRKELLAVESLEDRKELYEKLVEAEYVPP